MSQDTSSSSSEDEDHSAASAVPEATGSRTSRFQCPPDFVPCNYKPCSGTQNISSDAEIWLIKAPANFDPQSFSGVKLNLHGLERVSVPLADGTEKAYNVLSSPTPCPELRLMVPPGKLGPSLSGVVNISETNIDHSTNRALHVIPAIPPPSIPPGLKQRFQHYQAPTVFSCRQEEEVPRKKKKKEKKIKSEPQEASDAAMPTQTEVVIKTEIKEEPMDTGFGDQHGVHKKKKKKKKSKSAEESF